MLVVGAEEAALHVLYFTIKWRNMEFYPS